MSEEINTELKNIIEAALLVAGQPLTLDQMLQLFPEESQPARDELRQVLSQLEADYEGRGIEIKRIDRGYRVQSRTRYSTWLSRLNEEKPPRYSRAALETLAIIAYRQPVTRGDIEEIRGVTVSSDIIRNLLERDWIRQVGQRDVPGKPSLYGTTRTFLEYFSLKSLDELPTLAELRDLDEIGRELNLTLDLGDDGQADSASASADVDNAEADPDVSADEDEVSSMSSNQEPETAGLEAKSD